MATRISPDARRTRRPRLEPRKSPVQQRSVASVEAILTAAAQIFDAEGYAAGTTNHIAARAGVSIGTLYQYFPNKEALAVTLLERHLDEGTRVFADLIAQVHAQPQPLRQALRTFVDALLELHKDRPRLQHLLLEEAPRPPRVDATFHRVENAAVEAVEALLRGFPEVRHGNLERAAYMTVQAVQDLTHRFAAHPPRHLSRQQFADELVAMVEAYLRQRRAPAAE